MRGDEEFLSKIAKGADVRNAEVGSSSLLPSTSHFSDFGQFSADSPSVGDCPIVSVSARECPFSGIVSRTGHAGDVLFLAPTLCGVEGHATQHRGLATGRGRNARHVFM